MQENGPERRGRQASRCSRCSTRPPDPRWCWRPARRGCCPASSPGAVREHPERVVIGHPFNPPHLIPLVEVVPGEKTSEDGGRRGDGVLHRDRQAADPAASGAARARREPAAGRAVAGGLLAGRPRRRDGGRHRHRHRPRPGPALGGARAVRRTSTCPAGPAASRTSSSTSARRPRRGGATWGRSRSPPSSSPSWWPGSTRSSSASTSAELVARRDAVLTALLAAKARTELP